MPEPTGKCAICDKPTNTSFAIGLRIYCFCGQHKVVEDSNCDKPASLSSGFWASMPDELEAAALKSHLKAAC